MNNASSAGSRASWLAFMPTLWTVARVIYCNLYAFVPMNDAEKLHREPHISDVDRQNIICGIELCAFK